MLEEGCLLIPRGRKRQPVPTLCVSAHRVEWRGPPNFQGEARYPSTWKGCKILMEVDENGDVVDFKDEVDDVEDVDDHAKDDNVEEARNQFASGHGE